MCNLFSQIDEDMTARISMADVKFSFQCPGRMYSPAWVAPEGRRHSHSTDPGWQLEPLSDGCRKIQTFAEADEIYRWLPLL